MNVRLACLALGVCLAAAAPAPDVDVVVSAGTPFDWLGDLSRPTPTRSRSVPGAGFDRSTVVETAPRVFSTDVYRFAKITTVDLIGEIPWTVRRDVPTPGGGTPTPGGWAVQPPNRVPDDVLWLGLAILLKRALHPALVSQTETEEYLVHLGEASLLAVEMGKVDPAVDEICSAVASRVAPAPASAPVARGKTALDGMLQRLVVEDLASAYPFAFDGRFGARLALLGDEMVGPVIEATRSKHPFLRRNATLMLGRYPSASAADRLRELLEDRDAVVQSRALEALSRRRDRASVPVLLQLLKKKAAWPPVPSLVRALGEIGDPSAVAPIRAQLAGDASDYDVVFACVLALSRLVPPDDEAHLKLLDRVEALSYVDPQSPYQPVMKDAPGTRNAVMRQLVRLARARAGHAASAAEVLAQMPREGSPTGAPFFPRGGMRSPLLGAWHPPVIYPLIETLRGIPGGDVPLLRIAADRAEDLSVRIRAIAELARINPPGLAERLGGLVSTAEEFSVARSALHVLAALAGPAGVERAKACVEAYSPSQDPSRKALVAEAIQVLAVRNALDPAAVARIVECEIILHERGRNRPAPPPPPPPGAPQTALNFESPVSYLEDIVLALGPCREEWARGLLRDVLSMPGLPGRAEAAVALAAARDPADAPVLLAALKDKDPWVRFMAYRALKHVLGKDAPCDWLYGSDVHRSAAVAKYAQWVKELAD